MRIQQGFIRPSLSRVFPGFMARWGLTSYHSSDLPAVFFGCYDNQEWQYIKRHTGPALIVWLGSDFAIQGQRALFQDRREQFTHIAIGKWLEDDLFDADLPYRRVNLVGSPLIRTLKPVPLGAAVYSYLPSARRDLFGGSVLDKVMQLRPDVEFIVSDGMEFKRKDMQAIYERCCIGLRFTAHDGGAETAIELGLMGRHCVHNSDIPNGIRWRSVDDALRAIDFSLGLVGQTNEALAAEVHEYLQWDDDWLEVAA